MNRFTAALALVVALAGPVSADNAPARADKPPFYPDKSKLLHWLDADGKEQPVRTVADWAKRREHILRNMQEVMGPLPPHDAELPLDVQVLEEVDLGLCIRKKITFVAEPADRVSAYLFVPTAGAPVLGSGKGRPAVLCLHPTNRQIGKGVIAGLGPLPNRAYALELAERGYVTIAPDYPNSGEHKPDVYGRLGYVSNTMKAIVNNRRAIDLLCSLPGVDPERIGCIGHSLGGHNTVFTAVFDRRIKAAVSCCGFCAFGKYMKGDLRGWSHDGYMPRIIKDYGADPKRMPFDFHELIAALAPRAFLAVAPEHDSNFDVGGVREVMTAAASVYALHGASDKLRAVYPDAAHDFPNSARGTAYAFLDKHLNGLPVAARPAGEAGPKMTPLSPQQELATFRVQPGFRVELVAAEPDVVDPVALAFDEHGRLYVCEMIGYPNEGTGEGNITSGRIRLLTLDEHGRCTKSTVFAEGLIFPDSVMPWGKGVLVGNAPDLLYLEDTDGDGKADVRKVLYTGFGRKNIQQMINHIQWGIDNRVHVAGGGNGGEITCPDRPDMAPLVLRGRNFSFDPARPGSMEAESGGCQYALTTDDYGRWFTNDNTHHIRQIMVPDRYLRRNPYLAVPTVTVDIGVDSPTSWVAPPAGSPTPAVGPRAGGPGSDPAADEHGAACRLFRISPDESWRLERTAMRAGAPDRARYLTTELVPSGYITSACALTVYRGGLLGSEYHGNAFTCDPANNLIHRDRLSTEGPQVQARRADVDCEFFASTDIFCRPVDLTVGPDGALYFADFYRQVIETPASLPDVIKKKYPLDSWGRGRIWRIMPQTRLAGGAPGPSSWKSAVFPGRMNTEQLVAALESPNSWVRLTAQRLLVDRRGPEAVQLLERLAVDKGKPALARVHAFWTLAGLGHRPPAALAESVSGGDPILQVHAVKLAEHLGRDAWTLIKPTSTTHPEVRFQLAFVDNDRDKADLLLAAPTDPWLQTAVLSSARKTAPRLLQRLLNLDATPPSSFHHRLSALIGATADADVLNDVVAAVEEAAARRPIDPAILIGLREGLRRNAKGAAAAERLRVAMSGLVDRALTTSADEQAPVPDRVAALRLVAFAPVDKALPALRGLLSPETPGELQQAAVRTLSTLTDAGVAPALLSGWNGYTPSMRREVIEALFARNERLPHLLDALEKGKVGINDLEPVRRQQLKSHSDAAVRARAEKLPAGISADRAKVVEDFRPALELKADPVAGRAIFKKHCIVCHRLENEGVEVGPDLAAALRNKTRDVLLTDILDPSREVDPRYRMYAVLTRDGRTLTGMLAADTGASITLRREKQAEDVVLRAEIDRIRATPNSVMPEGFEKHIGRQELADLIGYLLSTVGR